ncbi:MAG: alpha/beta hydrolase [Alphaproteobacteria bacterium]|nr:alpha/beta hydrolase [Alphaproteobacteria bacterium]MBU6472140.1 alpha/beta hydrolase [Alphaproteobacteria bacterium]MDE2011899.1 alpha/beta hydrolase [Alphaproteobacteria bacterium]MDE2074985.1 alpha/beta hydrolase [Alphaproteobacteria bacterium]MDE2350428.1 alpha/beta hydrolase [Alphaproteobacteria bacterium]
MTSFPEPTMIKTNGIDMAVYEMGPKDGVPVVLCHGFPELAYSWRHQLPALAAAGYRAIAPDMRGYGRSSRPEAVGDYDIVHLTGDLVGLLGALGLKKAVFAGHDWGGLVVWAMPLLHPDRVAGVIGINTPFLPRAPIDPVELLRAAYGDNNYIVYFQKPGVADAILAKDVAKTFRFFMRKNGVTAAEYAKLPREARRLELVRALQQDESGWAGEVLLNAAEMKVFVDTYTRTGFTGGINWYRNLRRNWELMAPYAQKVNVPALMIMAEDDVVLSPAMAEGMEQYVPDLEKVLIPHCSHWTQQEHPEEVNGSIAGWLKRHFPGPLD